MKITFDLNIEDWIAFQEYFKARKAPFYKLLPLLLGITAVVVIALNLILYFSSNETSWVTMLSFILLIIIFYLIYLKRKADGQVRKIALELKEKNPDAFGFREMIFDETGLEIKTSSSGKKLNWGEMDRYEENNDYFYLYSRKGVVYIIPKRKIDLNPQELSAFFNSHFPE